MKAVLCCVYLIIDHACIVNDATTRTKTHTSPSYHALTPCPHTIIITQQEAPMRETAALMGGVAVTCLAMVGVLVWHVALSWQKKVQ